jgi:uncharacterized membrane protein (UPF0127 family)
MLGARSLLLKNEEEWQCMATKQREEQKRERLPRQRRAWMIVLVIIIVLGVVLLLTRNRADTDMPFAPTFKKQGELTFINREDKSIVTIDIEIADDESKREVGMMGRRTMEERQGMLFIFEQEEMASFWMKNTIVPLDMLFINKLGEIVTVCKNTTPFSEQSYSATAPALFVLEVNAGFADRFGIKVGDRINWKRY